MRFAIAALLVAAALVTAASAATKPRLWVTHSAPIRLAGSGYPHGTSVTVTVQAGTAKRVKTVRATRTGRISASFAPLPTVTTCRGMSLVATAKAPKIAAVTIHFSLPGSSRDCAPKQPVNS